MLVLCSLCACSHAATKPRNQRKPRPMYHAQGQPRNPTTQTKKQLSLALMGACICSCRLLQQGSEVLGLKHVNIYHCEASGDDTEMLACGQVAKATKAATVLLTRLGSFHNIEIESFRSAGYKRSATVSWQNLVDS
jgi:hypothetical protein